jgi:D-aminoacyl-tRNA deacylase
MRVVIQRVNGAYVEIENKINGEIDKGLVVLLGIEDSDTEEDVKWLTGKIARLRIFDDDQGVMNKSLMETDGDILLVSQFTLHASTKKGNRPSYIRAAKPDVAIPLYEKFVQVIEAETGKKPATGIFGANMKVALTNDGPVTIIIDSKNRE